MLKSFLATASKFLALVEERWLCIALSLMGLTILSDVIIRTVTRSSIYGTQEVVSYLGMSVITIGAAAATRTEKHIDVDIIYRYLPLKAQGLLKIFNSLFTVFMTIIWLTWTIPLVVSAVKINELSPMLLMPMFIVKGLLPLGAVLMIIYSVAVTTKKIRAYLGKNPNETERIEA